MSSDDSNSINKRLADLEEAIYSAERATMPSAGKEPLKIPGNKYMYGASIGCTVAIVLLLYFADPKMCKSKKDGKMVRDPKKFVMWAVIFSAIAWIIFGTLYYFGQL